MYVYTYNVCEWAREREREDTKDALVVSWPTQRRLSIFRLSAPTHSWSRPWLQLQLHRRKKLKQSAHFATRVLNTISRGKERISPLLLPHVPLLHIASKTRPMSCTPQHNRLLSGLLVDLYRSCLGQCSAVQCSTHTRRTEVARSRHSNVEACGTCHLMRVMRSESEAVVYIRERSAA